MSETKVSGNIFAAPDSYAKCGYTYVVFNSIGQGWGIPTRDITPDDLRAMADHFEQALKDKDND